MKAKERSAVDMNRKILSLISVVFCVRSAYAQSFTHETNILETNNLFYIIIFVAILIVSIMCVAMFVMRRKIKSATKIISKQKEQLELAIRAGDIRVWGYDIKARFVYNIIGQVVAEPGVPIEEANKTIHEEDLPLLSETIMKIINGESAEGIIVRSLNSSNGEWQYVKKEFIAIKDSKGNITGVIGTHKDVNRDILEQNKIDALLKKYQTVFDASSVGLEIYDKDGIVIDYNQSEAEILGITSIPKSDILDKKLCFFDNPCYIDAIPCIKNRQKYDGVVEYDFDLPSYKGISLDSDRSGKRYVQLRITPIVNSQGDLENIVCASIDVTEAQRLSNKLAVLNREKELIIDMLPLGLSICNKEGVNIFINKANAKILEVESVEEYLSRKINIFNPLQFDKNLTDSVRSNSEEEVFIQIDFDKIREYDIYKTQGVGIKYLKISHRIIENTEQSYYMLMIRDVTESHIYHTEIEKSKKKIELAVQSSNLIQWDYNNITKEISMTGADNLHFNMHLDELMSRISADDIAKAQSILEIIDQGHDTSFSIDMKVNSIINDKLQFLSINGAPLQYDETGKVISYTGFRRNNTEWFNLNKELKKQNDLNKMILDNINSGLVCIDKNHTVIWENVSEKFPMPFSCGKQMFVSGKKCENTHSEFKPACEECLIDCVMSSSLLKNAEKILPNGNVVEIIASPIKDANGNHNGAVLRVDDITERTRLYNEIKLAKQNAESSRELLSEILDRIPSAIFIKDVDNDFKYIVTNILFCNISEKTKEQMLEKNDYDLFDDATADKFKAVDLKVIEEGAPITVIEESVIQGELAYWSTTKSIIETYDGRRLLIALGVNLTEIYKVNKELKRAKEKAEQSDKLKSSFLANMSHEIRTPLNAIVGFSELLSEADDEDKEAYSQIIATNNDLLLRLINDILDLSKIDAGAVTLCPEKIDFASFFKELALMMQQRITNPAIEFIVENPYDKFIVEFDKNRISQVIINYVTNAIKYTPNGFIKMGYEYVDNGIKIYVEDSGIGIADDKKDRVFGRFQKLDEFAQGTGLGLSICKAIMELHNGKVGFESELDKGSTFWAWKPCEDGSKIE